MKQRNYIAILTLAVLCLTGCGKQQEEVPVETKPSIVTKNDVIGGTKAGDEEEKKKAEEALQRGIVSYYTNDVETFVASTDVDVLFTMMNGNAPNETELIASLKKRLPLPVYDEHNNTKIVDYTLQEIPNNRILDEETGEILALDWLSALSFPKPEEVTVTVEDEKVIDAKHPIWVFFQGKYYDSNTEWAYRKRKTVMPYNPEDLYEVDKAYEITYKLGVHDEETDTDIETEHIGYAVRINDEWKYEIAVADTDDETDDAVVCMGRADEVFNQYLKESGLDENGNVADVPESSAENNSEEIPTEETGEADES